MPSTPRTLPLCSLRTRYQPSPSSSGSDETARVSLVAAIGYVAFLVGPPALGFLGDHYGPRPAMLEGPAFVATAAVAAPAAGTRTRPSPPAGVRPESSVASHPQDRP
jgi:MFS family permease